MLAMFALWTAPLLAACTPVVGRPTPTPSHTDPVREEPDAGGEPAQKPRDAGQQDAGAEPDERAPQGGSGGQKKRVDETPDAGKGQQADAGAMPRGGAPAERTTPDAGIAGRPGDAGGTPADASTPRWACRSNNSGACICTQSDTAEDSCPKPLPSCCFTLLTNGQASCECWPADSASCRDYRNDTQDPNLIAACPPK